MSRKSGFSLMLAVLLMVLVPLAAWSAVFSCKDATGHTIYSDHECSGSVPPPVLHSTDPFRDIDSKKNASPALSPSMPQSTQQTGGSDFHDGMTSYMRQDYEKAFPLLLRAAEGGDSTAQNLIGVMHMEGQGRAQDYAAAITWFQRSASAGNSLAQINLGISYEQGFGVAQSDKQAEYWYGKASAQGDERAKKLLNTLRSKSAAAESVTTSTPAIDANLNQARQLLKQMPQQLPAHEPPLPKTQQPAAHNSATGWLVIASVVFLAWCLMRLLGHFENKINAMRPVPGYRLPEKSSTLPTQLKHMDPLRQGFLSIIVLSALAFYACYSASHGYDRGVRFYHLITVSPNGRVVMDYVFAFIFALGALMSVWVTIGIYIRNKSLVTSKPQLRPANSPPKAAAQKSIKEPVKASEPAQVVRVGPFVMTTGSVKEPPRRSASISDEEARKNDPFLQAVTDMLNSKNPDYVPRSARTPILYPSSSATDEATRRHASLLRASDEQRKADPWIGAKLGAKEITQRLIRMLTDKRGVHTETILCGVGALAGYACQESVRVEFIEMKKLPERGVFMVIECSNGKKYYFGDALNKPLAESKNSVWSLASETALELGAKQLIDFHDIFKRATATIGDDTFGIPRVPEDHKPGDTPANCVKYIWPILHPVVKQFCPQPSEWPVLYGFAIQEIMTLTKDVIDPALALSIVMECAIPMSKVDFNTL